MFMDDRIALLEPEETALLVAQAETEAFFATFAASASKIFHNFRVSSAEALIMQVPSGD